MSLDYDSETLVCAMPVRLTTTLIVRDDSKVIVVIRCAICGRSARAHWDGGIAECTECGERDRIAVAEQAG